MTGHRMSLLPITVYCGQAGALSKQYGAGRPAAMSQAFHARQAGAPSAEELWVRLSDVERDEVSKWQPVADVVCLGQRLTYAEAEKEFTLGLDDFGFYADPDVTDCLTVGHADFGWVIVDEGVRIAVVGDIKKTVWTTSDGPESLQLHAYGWAYAKKNNCASYCVGLWLATEGEWLWAKEMVTLASDRGRQIWERIYAAASRETSEASTGGHCRSCWSRMHCPEFLLPAALQSTELAPAASGVVPSPGEAAVFVQRLQTLEELVELAKKNIQEAIRRGALVVTDPETGKRYLPVMTSGRETVDVKKLKAECADADRYLKRGTSFEQFRWLNARAS